jgi:hypothetical protein
MIDSARQLCALVLGILFALVAMPVNSAEPVRFNRDVRPILSEYCGHCHGPDATKREADLRLDQAEDALRRRDDHAVIVPGKPELSTLIARITSTDADERMPPASSQRTLTAAQIDTLRRWITEGAKFESHWSFVAPQKAPLPEVKEPGWARQPFDHYIQAAHDRLGITHAPQADAVTLIRRLSFDLTGLPPTPEMVERWKEKLKAESRKLENTTPQRDSAALSSQLSAFDSQLSAFVDDLLASSRYGERMALPWLDAARYADTNGYQTDGPRNMWRWRDWVIDAFNRNQPFDQFTIEQLAGDLLPNATLDQRIATGFNRNHRGNAEGGIIPEEFRIEYVVDRVETTSTVWLGMTLGCCRCHDHKYDPVSQREFYQLFAFFNQVPEPGKAVRDDNSPPMVKAPTPEMREQLQGIDQRLAQSQQRLDEQTATLQAALQSWQASGKPSSEPSRELLAGLTMKMSLDGDLTEVREEPTLQYANLSSLPPTFRSIKLHEPAEKKTPAWQRQPPRFVDGDAKFVPGKVGQAVELDGRRYVDLDIACSFREMHRFSFGAWVQLADRHGGTVVAKMEEDANHKGYGIHVDEGKVQVVLSGRLLDDAMIIESEQTLEPGRWYHLFATYDGNKFASGLRLYIDGQLAKTRVLMDLLSNAIVNDDPLRIGSRGEEERFRGLIDDVRIYARDLSAEQVAILATADDVPALLKIPAAKRTPAQQAKLWAEFVANHAPQAYREQVAQHEQLREERRMFEEQLPTVMVMLDQPGLRKTNLLLRGEYDRPGEQVEPGVPACFPPLPKNAPADRLALARWLTSREHPLTARVTVNRIWQQLFGQGLVKTAEDFGTQGEPPVHPEVLDWLAVDFVEHGWDVKRLVKTIVTSATYLQSSKAIATGGRGLEVNDPDNRLLARGARFRLSAEMVRDQALFASGLLVERVGGPSVKPYQPPGLWEEIAAAIVPYVQDHGDNLYRRSMYTFWKRTVAPPAMMTFDAAGREACVVRTSRTNTPLQALNLLNDVTYVEAARALAQRVMRESPTTDERITRMFRHVLAREPRDDELALLRKSFDRHITRFRNDPAAARKLLAYGESPRDESLDVVEHAALAAVASTVLNLDETVTRE